MKTVEVLDLQKLAHKILAITIDCEEDATPARYEQTRSSWKLSPARANEADYVFSVTRGIVKAIYKTDSKGWQADALREKRYLFEGTEVTDPEITNLYLGKKIEKKKGQANPIQYLYGGSDAKDDTTDAIVITPKDPTTINSWEYSDNDTLTAIIIPDTVTSIGSYAFRNCSALKSVVIPDSVTEIDSGAFARCTSLESVTIPDTITTIPGDMFADCTALQSITIPNSVTTIGGDAFSNCTSLKSVAIPNSVKEIESTIFKGCTSLESITFAPASKDLQIAPDAFSGCDTLSQESQNVVQKVMSLAFYIDEYGALYTTNKKNFISAVNVAKDVTEYTVLDGVLGISENAFECSHIEKIILPKSLRYIYFGAFRESALKEIVLPKLLKSIHAHAFADCAQLTHIDIPENITQIEDSTFVNAGLKSVTLPSELEEIGYEAFSGTALETIAFPDSLRRIDQLAFVGNKFKELTFPASLTFIGADAFAGCRSLKGFILENDAIEIGTGAFTNCDAITDEFREELIDMHGERIFVDSEEWEDEDEEWED